MIRWTCKSFDQLSAMELYQVLALRQRVFVVEQYCPYQDADGKDVEVYHLMGWDKNKHLIAYARLIPKGISYPNETSIGRIMTHPKTRGTGTGSKLLVAALQEMEKLFGVLPIRIGAQAYLMSFYEKFGFKTEGNMYLEDGIPHFDMVRHSY